MRDEYDFDKMKAAPNPYAEKLNGQADSHAADQKRYPVLLDEEVQAFVARIAEQRKLSTSDVVNELIKCEMAIAKVVNG